MTRPALRRRVTLAALWTACVLLIVLAGASQGFAAGRFTWPSWILAAVTAVLAAVLSLAKRPLELASAALGRPMERRQRQREIVESIPGYGVRVDESTARIEMDVHPSVELPEGADPGLSAYFPEYVARDLDDDIRAWIRSRKASGGFIVLVGDAAAGKTRMLYEAPRHEVPSWQMLCPDGAQVHALAQSEAGLAPAVLWLDDVETYIGAGMLTGVTLKRLISRPGQPVLVAATIRTEELAKAFERPASGDEPEINRQCARCSARSGAGREPGRDNLRMHWSQLRAAYGQDGVEVHVRTVEAYAEGLLHRGDAEAAALWRERAGGPWVEG
ncbi:hypothetical protein [Dactylosporangium darangshiense]|uniref:AAA family ATPase n=1 Tax=Dactylosporangium darangshiense TaxID=579108 RepID=A0ABP8DBB6_9ACTN